MRQAGGQRGFVVVGPQFFGYALATRNLEFLELLIKVLVELDALHHRGIGLLQLVTIETDEYSLDIVDEFVNPL